MFTFFSLRDVAAECAFFTVTDASLALAAVPQTDALKTGNVHKNSTVQTIDGPFCLATDDNATAERTTANMCTHEHLHVCTLWMLPVAAPFFGGTQLDVGSSAAGGATRCIWLTAPIFLWVQLGKEFPSCMAQWVEPHIGDVRVLGCNEVSYMSLRKERVAEDSVQS